MAQRRKISLQNMTQKKPDQEIDRLVQDMGTTNLGFTPTDQIVYEVELNRIKPDSAQSRHVLPYDLWEQLTENDLVPSQAILELIERANRNDQVALLILGGQVEQPVVEYKPEDLSKDEVGPDEERGLLFLAASIREIGLRQPINLYSIPNSDHPSEPYYQIGEGERRYWAHHLLVAQGFTEFGKIRAVIEVLPPDQDIIQRRQEAENAARQDLAGIARARSIKRVRNRLSLELGTRVPGQTTIKLPSQRELDIAVGQEVKTFTGRAISDRMVRNYLRLLQLSSPLQDLVEAAQLTEKQLRPVLRLESEADQRKMINDIIREKMSGQTVLNRVQEVLPATSLKMTKPTTLEQRLEKRLFQTVKTVHEVFSLGQDAYMDIVRLLSERMQDTSTKEALMELRQVINDLIGDVEAGVTSFERKLAIQMIQPPLDAVMPNLPAENQTVLQQESGTGLDLWQLLLTWQQADPLIGSRLYQFFEGVEKRAEQIQANEEMPTPVAKHSSSDSSGTPYPYQLVEGKLTYWAHIMLLHEGLEAFDAFVVIIAE